MENVLVAFIIIFLILFSVFTLSETFLSTQDMIRESWQAMQTRLDDQFYTSLLPTEARTTGLGTIAEVTLVNNGSSRVADFDKWDVIVEYYDGGSPAIYRFARLSYTDQALAGGDWTVAGIYSDVQTGTAEIYDRGILDPGEEITLRLKGTSPIGAGTTAHVIIAAANGSRAAMVFTGNMIPTLASNTGLTVSVGSSAPLNSAELQALDDDDAPVDLVYTVTAPPTQGYLSLDTAFTQADIDAGRLTYTHTGSESDSFQFTVSDGKDTTGVFSVAITASEPPVLAVNTGLTILASSTATISTLQLQAVDPDNLPESLVYTVSHGPVQGTLSLENSFTQMDIDDGLLTYTHTGVGSDSLQITISDGAAVIGPYNVVITVQ